MCNRGNGVERDPGWREPASSPPPFCDAGRVTQAREDEQRDHLPLGDYRAPSQCGKSLDSGGRSRSWMRPSHESARRPLPKVDAPAPSTSCDMKFPVPRHCRHKKTNSADLGISSRVHRNRPN